MAKGLFVGIGSAGALAAAAAGYYATSVRQAAVNAPSRALEANASDPCIVSRIRLVEGMTPACFTSAQYEALRDRSVISGAGDPVTVNLEAPDPTKEGAAARTCAEYDAMTEQGWYALSNADMRREEYFKRACGALSMLVKGRAAVSSHFSLGKAAKEDVLSLAEQEAIVFGEPEPSVSIEVTNVEEGVWRMTIGQGETMIYEIAHADFNGDGLGEILAYMSTGPAGGTARVGAIGLIEKNASGGPCSFTAR